MSKRIPLGAGAALLCLSAFAQNPEPPRALPPGITGTATAGALTPVRGDQQAASVPMTRFTGKPHEFPVETMAAVESVKLGSDWLFRMNQPGGRFAQGLNPTLRQWVEDSHDALRQGLAVRGYVAAARFTGDERHLARAAGGVLTLLTLTKAEADGSRSANFTADRGNKAIFAALTILSIHELPSVGPDQLVQADALAARLATLIQPSGVIEITDGVEAGIVPSQDRLDAGAGLVLQALIETYRRKSDATLRDVLPKAVAAMAREAKAKPTVNRLSTAIPCVVEYALLAGKEPGLCALAFELTDMLVAVQVPRTESRRGTWIGGFAKPGEEPNIDSALAVTAICRSAYLTRQVPDLARFQKYRRSAVDGIGFLRTLQLTDEATDHFTPAFRTKFLNGGVRSAPADGSVRADACGVALTAWVGYLTQGTERD